MSSKSLFIAIIIIALFVVISSRPQTGIVIQEETEENFYTPEQVLELGQQLDGQIITIQGIVSNVPKPHPLTLGGVAGPGFKTDKGHIVIFTNENYDAYQNRQGIFNLNSFSPVTIKGTYVALPLQYDYKGDPLLTGQLIFIRFV